MSDIDSDKEEDYDSGDNEDFTNNTNNIKKPVKLILQNKNDFGADIMSEDEDENEEDEDEEDDNISAIIDGAKGPGDEDEDYYDDDDSDDEGSEAAGPDDDDDEPSQKKKPNSKVKQPSSMPANSDSYDYDDDDDDDDDDENYLQKFDNDINKNYILDNHPECLHHNYDEITSLSRIVRDKDNIIIDPLHKTIPILTKYERARILGQRAKQIESGAKPLVKIPDNIIDGYLIAELELREKKIPFVIKRPLPDGSCEYWSVKDLELIIY
uniref:DNA-directed RNA polymerase n=1 Tax=viral metagenome TaxID=1070528 RepID=A0A6C0IGC4_9ZZZZ